MVARSLGSGRLGGVKRAPKSHLITDAERSPEEELRSREIRYVVMMGIRALCVVIGAVLVMLKVPLLPLWLVLCVAGAVLLPMSAVMLANDRAPKPEHRLRNKLRSNTPPRDATHALPAQPGQPEAEHKVIDPDN
jgi:Protein of unknown function (DUF3099)